MVEEADTGKQAGDGRRAARRAARRNAEKKKLHGFTRLSLNRKPTIVAMEKVESANITYSPYSISFSSREFAHESIALGDIVIMDQVNPTTSPAGRTAIRHLVIERPITAPQARRNLPELSQIGDRTADVFAFRKGEALEQAARRLQIPLETGMQGAPAPELDAALLRLAAGISDLYPDRQRALIFLSRHPIDDRGRTIRDILRDESGMDSLERISEIRFGPNG